MQPLCFIARRVHENVFEAEESHDWHLDASHRWERAYRNKNSMHMKKSLKSIDWTMLNASPMWCTFSSRWASSFSMRRMMMNSFLRPRSMWFHCQQQSQPNQFHSPFHVLMQPSSDDNIVDWSKSKNFYFYCMQYSPDLLAMLISSFFFKIPTESSVWRHSHLNGQWPFMMTAERWFFDDFVCRDKHRLLAF